MVYTEEERLRVVKKFNAYNFDLNKNLHNILKLSAEIYETPVAFLTLIDRDDQWFKVRYGYDVLCMPRATSFCTHVIMQDDTYVVSDASKDIRFAGNPLVKDRPYIKFYAGAPLSTAEGANIGTLCVMDIIPKYIPENKRALLEILAKQAMHIIELDLTYKLLDEKVRQIEQQNKTLMDIAHIQSHEFRGPLSTIMGVMQLIRDNNFEPTKELLLMLDHAVDKLDEKIHLVVRSTEVAKSANFI